MLLLVAAIAAPVISAMSLCAMPCCHHGSSPNGSLAGQFPCPTKCTITKTTDDVAAVAPQSSTVSAQATVAAVSADPGPVPTACRIAVASDQPIPSHRPLHLVNSVFLI